MSSAPVDYDGAPPGVRLVPAGAVVEENRAAERAGADGRDPIAVLIERIATDPLVAWEASSLELVAPLRGQDDLALQRVRLALKKAKADVTGWERAVNDTRRRMTTSSGGGAGSPPTLDVRERYSDAWNASRFAVEYRNRLRFVPERGWFAWTGSHWRFDDQAGTRGAQDFAAELALLADSDQAIEPARRFKVVDALGSRSKIQAIETLARARLELTAHIGDFDGDAFLLNCANGMVDLRTGHLREHDPNELCSREVPAAYDPSASAPTFDAFLARVQPDPEVRAFLQRWAGYCATGATNEQCLVVHWGTGANGKSTFVEALNFVLGRYAQLVPSDVLLARSGQDAHPTERAQLCGLRHALVSETTSGKGWNENAVKQLTGDTKMSARYMRQDFFEFTITHKLSVCTNNRPEVRENSHAFWRRVHLIPWAVQIPESEKDPNLLEKLRAEALGILAWIVRGAVEWSEQGLCPPAGIRAATESYRNESDRIGQFLEERTRPLDGARTPASALYRAWSDWCEARGESAGSQTAFGERMGARDGIVRVKVKGSKAYRGIVLRDANDGATDGADEEVIDGGTVWGDGSAASVPPVLPSKFSDERARGTEGDGCGEVPLYARAPADAGVVDTRAPSRAPLKTESSLGCADSRDNRPPLSPREDRRGNSLGLTGGTVAQHDLARTVPHSADNDDGEWEDP
ncbi:MAG: phage/plasmid primase, P4 family [Polyangiales bacterium]